MYCDNWTETGRERSLSSRRKAQGRHDSQCVEIIREVRAQGLSWRRTAAILSESGIPTPRGRGDCWTHPQVARIARRHGIG